MKKPPLSKEQTVKYIERGPNGEPSQASLDLTKQMQSLGAGIDSALKESLGIEVAFQITLAVGDGHVHHVANCSTKDIVPLFQALIRSWELGKPDSTVPLH